MVFFDVTWRWQHCDIYTFDSMSKKCWLLTVNVIIVRGSFLTLPLIFQLQNLILSVFECIFAYNLRRFCGLEKCGMKRGDKNGKFGECWLIIGEELSGGAISMKRLYLILFFLFLSVLYSGIFRKLIRHNFYKYMDDSIKFIWTLPLQQPPTVLQQCKLQFRGDIYVFFGCL